jgi:precorrin-2 dehydrogenase / sirohydrochlorin ferrochelatase
VLPILLSPQTPVGLIGEGEGLERRRTLLEASGVTAKVLPPDASLEGLRLLYIAGLAPSRAEALASRARDLAILVNVEDIPALCDFHVPAILRRGDLLFTVSTGGRAPGLARRLREWLQAAFGPEWEARSGELGNARDHWREEGVEAGEIAARTRAIIATKGWLS